MDIFELPGFLLFLKLEKYVQGCVIMTRSIMLLRLHSDVDDIREGNLYVTCIKGFVVQ